MRSGFNISNTGWITNSNLKSNCFTLQLIELPSVMKAFLLGEN
jgi:hypothetical protein